MTGSYLFWTGVVLNVTVLVVIAGLWLSPNIMFEEAAVKLETRLNQNRNPLVKKLLMLMDSTSVFANGGNSSPGSMTEYREIPLTSAANPEYEYPYQLYDRNGRPDKLYKGVFAPPEKARRVYAGTTEQILKAIKSAEPGDIISIAPGNYDFNGRSIEVNRAGEPGKPVYLRAERLGDATLSLNTMEGFHVKAPYWVFENLAINGICATDQKCEHAFHVVGLAKAFVLRNSTISDFNASVKVNGVKVDGIDSWPDDGLIEYNIFQNSSARATDRPVALLNIDSVDHWVVRGNFIADFSKLHGNSVAYGGYMKGNGNYGLFERNIVICEHMLNADGGTRIGLSFGGGGTEKKYCRNRNCALEHSGGIIRNNIILNCSNDVGIYLNKAASTEVYNNFLHNNLGIDVRFATSSARIRNNLISGRVKQRDGGSAQSNQNLIDKGCFGYNRGSCITDDIYMDPDNSDLRLTSVENPIWGKGIAIDTLTDDLCGATRVSPPDLGPIQYSNGIDCLEAQNPGSR